MQNIYTETWYRSGQCLSPPRPEFDPRDPLYSCIMVIRLYVWVFLRAFRLPPTSLTSSHWRPCQREISIKVVELVCCKVNQVQYQTAKKNINLSLLLVVVVFFCFFGGFFCVCVCLFVWFCFLGGFFSVFFFRGREVTLIWSFGSI